jgi:hypothetical protein
MLKAAFLVLALAGCGDQSDEGVAARACASVTNPDAAERCRTREVEQIERNREMENNMLGGIIAGQQPYRASAPAFVTCAPGAQGTVSCIGQ